MFQDKDIGDVQYQLHMMKMEKFIKFQKKCYLLKLPENNKFKSKGNPLDQKKEWKKIKLMEKNIQEKQIH